MVHETVAGLLADLGIDPAYSSKSLEVLAATDSRYLRDLRLNVSSTIGSMRLSRREANLLALAVAVTDHHDVLVAAFERLAVREGATGQDISETHACASLMAVNNIFYRFRHFMHGNEFYNKQPAGLRMSVMMNPALGKELYELMSLVLSAVNGCERCVTSHEHSLRHLGTDEPRIYDAVRLGSVIKSLCVII